MRKKQINVLVFPGGNEIGLEIRNSLKYCKGISLFSASSETSNHAPYVYRNHFVVSPVREGKNWIDEINRIIRDHAIDYLFPAQDYVIDAVNGARGQIRTNIVLPPSSVCTLVRSKSKTYAHFRPLLPVPILFSGKNSVKNFPVFIKPDSGYGSNAIRRVDNRHQLEARLEDRPDSIIMEYLPGREYTVDCFTSKRQGLLYCQARLRERIRMGTSVHSAFADKTVNEQLTGFARIIQENIAMTGAWHFQAKQDCNHQLKLLEIAPRIAGTMAFNRVRGVNFSRLSLYDLEGENITLLLNTFDYTLDRSLTNHYAAALCYRHVYVDLDETLIVNDTYNSELVQFLYQARGRGCQLTLLSKSLEKDRDAYLEKWHVRDIFDEVFWLREDESKADYIKSKDSIFIDDSFKERQDVARRHGIATFDCSMVEILLDFRI